jgi:flagellar hook assembly protein FlgD
MKPSEFALAQNYPNPFNAQTMISFSLKERDQISLEIFDILGQKIETIFDGQLEAGVHSFTWNASSASSGIYFYRLKAADGTKTERMTLLK